MKIVGLMAARNESWCLSYTARAALEWVDELLLFVHASTDATLQIADRLRVETGRVNIIVELDPEWREMEHRQRMLEAARRMGADLLALVDADEVLSRNLYHPVRAKAEILPPGFTLRTPLHNLWRSLDQARCDDTPYGQNEATLVVRDSSALAWQSDYTGYEHHARAPRGSSQGLLVPAERTAGGLMHLQHADWRRMTAKHRLYQMTEALRFPDRPRRQIALMYGAALDEKGMKFIGVPAEWWPETLDRNLIRLDEVPWHEAECERLLAEHEVAAFQGLEVI